MKKFFYSVAICLLLASCSTQKYWSEPDYNYIADHVIVVDKNSSYVVYEYSNIRIDEIAPVAALYCHNHGGKQASLYDINLRPDNSRRATFVCK